MPKTKPELVHDLAQQVPTVSERKPARKPGRDANEIFRVGDEADEPEYLNTIPAHVDVRRFVKHNYGDGDYLIKSRIGGRFKGERELHIELTPDEAETVEAEDDLDEPDIAPSLAQDDLVKLVAATVSATLDAREKSQRVAQPAPVDPFEFVERSLEIEEKMRERSARNNPPAPQAADPSENFLNMLDKFSAIAERIAPIRESDREGSSGVLSGLASVIREVATHGSSLIPLLPALVQQVQVATNGTAQMNGHQQVRPASVDPVRATLALITNDLKKNKRIGRAADAVEDLYLKLPGSEAHVAPLFVLPTADLLAQLSQFAGEDLTGYSHAAAWLGSLQDELSGNAEDETESEEPDEEPKENVDA
jgi:hypothetical protein